MGILDAFKKKAPGPCSACGKETAGYRCPHCHQEFCETCVRRQTKLVGEKGGGSRIKVSVVSGGAVDSRTSRGVMSRVEERMDAWREIVHRGGGVCISCFLEKEREIELKRL